MNSDNISDAEILQKFLKCNSILPIPSLTNSPRDSFNLIHSSSTLLKKEISSYLNVNKTVSNTASSIKSSEISVSLDDISQMNQETKNINSYVIETPIILSASSDEENEEIKPVKKITKKVVKKIIKKEEDTEQKNEDKDDVKTEEEKLAYLQKVLKETDERWEEEMNYMRDVRDSSQITPQLKQKTVSTIAFLLESNDKIRSLHLQDRDLTKRSAAKVIIKMFKYLYSPIGQTFLKENSKFFNTVSEKVRELKSDPYVINHDRECYTLLDNFEIDILCELRLTNFEKAEVPLEDRADYIKFKREMENDVDAYEDLFGQYEEEDPIVVLVKEFYYRKANNETLGLI